MTERQMAQRPKYTAREVGERLAGYLECQECKAQQECSAQQVAEYTRHGWPRCHELTMRLVPRPKGDT